MTPVTLITGASAGIGAELARVFAIRGHALVLVARREQRLNELAGQLGMIDLNMRALTDLSLSFVDSLACHSGGILNVASIAGVMPGPRSAVYYASKAFVLSFTEALHDELAPRGIRVSCLCPGPVASEFQTRAGIGEAEPLWPIVLPAARVAAEGYRGLMRGRRIVVPGWGPKLLFALMPRIVPRPFLLARLEGRQAGRKGLPSKP